MKTLIEIIQENIKNWHHTWSLAKIHQKKTYKGSDLGLVWAFAKPSMYIIVFYVAISIGFKSSKTIPGIICPYFVWLTVGMISFFFMRDMILNGASCFRKYGAFVTSAKYPVSTLPTTVAVSYMLLHLGMMILVFAVCFMFGTMPSIYWIEIPFYTVLMFVFSIFWSIATGLVSVVFKDFYNFLQVANQAVFWLSAILFDVNKITGKASRVFLFNPITYIVEGYRNAICRHIWFWEEPLKLVCYLFMMLLMIVVAVLMYKKLRKRIPDAL